ncbi:MAG: hypothetical protein JWR38_5981, partial [Mucilaginibacter sp.]|nr:hypothetical protein [Mucilaginibacter sp.]
MDIMTFPVVSPYRRVRTWLRYWVLRGMGYGIVNRWSHLWWLRPAQTTAKALERIRAELGLKDFGIALEYGCHNGRLSGAIASVSKAVWGIDIADRCPYPLDRYVKVTNLDPGHDDYIPSIADGSVDTVLVLNIVAFEPTDHWEDEAKKLDGRLARYL